MSRSWVLRLCSAAVTVLFVAAVVLFRYEILQGSADRYSDNEVVQQASNELQVVSATPSGMVQSSDQFYAITVIFNQPMVPLQALPEGDGTGPLVIEPAMPGKYRWLGSHTLTFTPSKTLPMASRFVVTVPSGLKSLSGQTLKTPYQWAFETPRPKLLKTTLEENARVALTPAFYLVFNQTVSLSSVQQKVTLINTLSGNKVPLNISLADTNDIKQYISQYSYYYDDNEYLAKSQLVSKVIKIKPAMKLPMETSYVLEIGRDIRGTEGNLGSEEYKSIPFATYAALQITEVTEPEYATSYFTIRFSNRVDASVLEEHLSVTPKAELRSAYNSYWDENNTIHISFDFKPRTRYRLKISKNLTDEYGNELGSDYVKEFMTGDYAASVSFNSGSHVIESYLGHNFFVYAINPMHVDLKMALLNQQELINLSNQDYFYTDQLDFNGWDFSWSGIPPTTPNQPQRIPVDCDKVLGNAKSGVVLIEMKHEPWHSPQRALVQITDISITAKFSKLQNLISVTSLRDAAPVAQAMLEIRDNTGQVKWSGLTDEQGFAKTPGWGALGLIPSSEWQEPILWVFAQKGDQVAFANSNNTIELYSFNVPYSWAVQKEDVTHGSLFTNQGIYRPGDEVKIKGIFRQITNDQLTLTPRKNIRIIIRNPDYEEILNQEYLTNAYGAIDFTHNIDANARLGYYSVSAEADGRSVTSVSFQVQEFKPVEMEVTIHPNKKSYVWGEKLNAVLDGHYLFGAPLGNESIHYSLSRSPSYFSPPGYDEYYFGTQAEDGYYSSYRYGGYSSTLLSKSDKLDDRGLLEIQWPLKSDGHAQTAMLTIEGTVRDKNRQEVSGRKNIIVHAGQFYIGLRPSTTFHTMGEPLNLDLITVSPDGEKIGDKPVKLELIRREWISVRQKTSEGFYEWSSRIRDTVESKQTVMTGAETSSLALHPKSTGYYIIKAQAQDKYENIIESSCYIYVTGSAYASWWMYNDDRIDLVPNKKNYAVGDKAKILVKSPWERTKALITIERDGILFHRTEFFSGNASVITIPIIQDFVPNIFVSVILMKGRTALPKQNESEDLGKPAFKIGYTQLLVNPDDNRLQVTVKPNKTKFAPKEWVDVDISVRDKSGKGKLSEVTLYVEDIGVLNLVSYKTPDPFDAFYQPRSLSVRTYEARKYVLDQIFMKEVSDLKGDVGGGGGEEFFPAIAIRKDFKACVYWNPSLMTDANGKVRARFQLPDNLTAFRIIAVAHNAESKFGSADKDITVSKQLMLRPALPRFARVGDALDAGVIVHNYSDDKGLVKLTADMQGVTVNDSTLRSFTLKEGESKEVRFKFKITESRTGIFTFKAMMNSYTDGVEVSMPLKVPTFTETVALYGSDTVNHKEEVIVPSALYAGYGGLEVKTASTALVDLDGSVRYLFEYPYGCLEQKTSRALPIILFADVVKAFNLPAFRKDAPFYERIQLAGGPAKSMDEVVQDYLDEIPKYQLYNGGFGYWIGGDVESPYVSTFAMLAMTKAKQNNYTINQSCYDKGITYLKALVRHPVDQPYGLYYSHITYAMALYVLAENNYYDAPTAELLFQRKDEMPLFARALLLKAVHIGRGHTYIKEELKRGLMNAIKMDPTTAHFEEASLPGLEWTYHSNTRTTAAILEAFLTVDGTNVPWAEKAVRYLLKERKIGRWRTTHENLFVFWALSSYFSAFEKTVPNFSSQVLVDGRSVLNEFYRGRTTKTASALVSFQQLRRETALPVDFVMSGEGRYYYTVRMTYAPKHTVQIAARDEGIKITKVYEDMKGNPVTQGKFTAGEMYKVKLTVSVPHDRYFIVVDDPLPAGFEAVNVNLATTAKDNSSENTSNSARWWWNFGGFNKSEMRDDRVVVFADRLPSGTHAFTYRVRATTYGTFELPPTKAEEMYAPEVFGNTTNQTVVVQ